MEKNLITKEFIKENLFDINGNISSQRKRNFNISLTLKDLWIIYYGYIPVCKNQQCNCIPSFINFRLGFREFCSNSCMGKNPKIQERKQKTKSKNIKLNWNEDFEFNENTYIKDIFIKNAKNIHNNKYIYDKLEYNGSENYISITCPIHGDWQVTPNNHINKKSGCPKCSFIGVSKPEIEITEFIKSLIPNIQVINSNKNVLNGKELDIYIPEHNIAIEYNGLMWHSIGKSDYSMFNTQENTSLKTSHLLKTQECENQGIQLFHIFENEWINEPEKWKNVIQDKLGLNKKIGARKTQIRPVQAKEARVFEDKNHLQGSGLSSIRYGLFYKEELICLMTFGKSRMSKMYEYELIRFCSKQGVTVQGGASKLLKHFERKHQPMSLVSYANRRWSQGNLYKTLGFELANISSPNHFYFKVNNLKLESRQKYQKHKLHKVLSNFNQKLSGIQNMLNNDFRIIYDSGNFVFYKKYSG